MRSAKIAEIIKTSKNHFVSEINNPEPDKKAAKTDIK